MTITIITRVILMMVMRKEENEQCLNACTVMVLNSEVDVNIMLMLMKIN